MAGNINGENEVMGSKSQFSKLPANASGDLPGLSLSYFVSAALCASPFSTGQASEAKCLVRLDAMFGNRKDFG